MLDLLTQLVPVFIYFGTGVLLRIVGIAERAHGDFLLRFVFFVTLPALILTALPQSPLTLGKAALPFANIAVNFVCMAASLAAARLWRLDRRTTGTLLVNTMIVNNSYMFPFILAVYGEAGFADAILFDFGNALMMATYVHALAFRYGGENARRGTMLLRIVKSPLVWALAIAVLLSASGTPLPPLAESVTGPLGRMTAPLILIALGIYFSPRVKNIRLALLTVGIRMGLGLLAGLAVASLLGLEGRTFAVVALCSAAPIGFNALTFSSLAKLDTALSSSAVSMSILMGLIYTPLLMLAFGDG